MDWVVKLGLIGSIASIISIVISIVGWLRTKSKGAKYTAGVSLVLGIAFCYLAFSEYHSVLDLEFTATADTLDLQAFLRELSRGEAKISIDPSVMSDLERQRVKIKVPTLKSAPLNYVLDHVLIPQMPGPEQWTYEVVGKTIMIKRR